MNKIFPSLLCCLIISNLCVAQQVDWRWARHSTDESFSQATAITTSKSGDVYFAGKYINNFTFGPANFTVPQSGEFFLTKVLSSGFIQWGVTDQNTPGGGPTATAMATDDTNNVFVSGIFMGFIDDLGNGVTLEANGVGNQAFCAIKYNSLGTPIWAKCATSRNLGGINTSTGAGVAVDMAGNSYFTGTFVDDILFDSVELTDNSIYYNEQFFLVKYNAAGKAMWATTARNGMDNYSVATGLASFGNYLYVAGYFNGDSMGLGTNGIVYAPNAKSYSFFIARYDLDSNLLWVRNAIGDSTVIENGITTDGNGNIYATGYFTGDSVQFGSQTLYRPNQSTPDTSFFVIKYDSAGNVLWAQTALTSGHSVGYSIAADAAGYAYVTGGFTSDSIRFNNTLLTVPTLPNRHIFIVTYDSNGQITCATSFGDGGSANLGNSYVAGQTCIAVSSIGDAYVGGTYDDSSFVIGPDSLTVTGTSDVFVARFNCGAETGIKTVIENAGLLIYPNPADDIATVKYTLPGDVKSASLIIYDIAGREQGRYLINNSFGAIGIKAGNLSAGVYMCSVVEEGHVLVTREMVVK